MGRSAPTANARGTMSLSAAHSSGNKRRSHLDQLPDLVHPPQAKGQMAKHLARAHLKTRSKAHQAALPPKLLLPTLTRMTLMKPFRCSWPTPFPTNPSNVSLRRRPNCDRATCNTVGSLTPVPPTLCALIRHGSRTLPPSLLTLKLSSAMIV